MKNPLRRERARKLRQRSTDAETVLWYLLRSRRLAGFKLAIEVDGGGHAEPVQASHDRERTEMLAAQGIHVLRFWDHQVLEQRDDVLAEIHRVLTASETR